jgi:hypoxanthine phosphoribosyltransferase
MASAIELAAVPKLRDSGERLVVARKPSAPRPKVLLRRDQIRRRVRAIARRMERDYRGERVHLICILKGACIFLADLLRELRLPVSVDFVAISSYGKGTLPSGEVRITKDLDASIENLNVVIVEDILDTGLTLNYLYRILQERKPRSLRIAALLDKPARRVKEVPADYVGFTIPDKFVVGYGLDFAEQYRNLPDVCVLPGSGEK